MASTYSVVIPAYNAERTIGTVIGALHGQEPPPAEVIVVDDGSTDRTAEIASRLGASVVRSDGSGFAGGARNRGWEAASSDVVVFLDSDAIPAPGWGTGLSQALVDHPGAIIGGGRTFVARSHWGWVTHLQFETPYLPRGAPRQVAFVSSYCMAVPRDLAIRFPESYGAEDGLFCARAVDEGIPIVFDPRFHSIHDDDRETFGQLRALQRRRAFALSLLGPIQHEATRKRLFSRVPIHYFMLLRLPAMFSRVRHFRQLRSAFVRLLPLIVVAEWTLGASATRHAFRRPEPGHAHGRDFR